MLREGRNAILTHMNEDMIIGLKQFIAVAISQQTLDLREDLTKLNQKMDDLSVAVAEALDTSNEATGTQ